MKEIFHSPNEMLSNNDNYIIEPNPPTKTGVGDSIILMEKIQNHTSSSTFRLEQVYKQQL